MVLDDIADAVNADTTRRVSRQTGLSKEKVYRISNRLPFVMNDGVILALRRLGYELCLQKLPRMNEDH